MATPRRKNGRKTKLTPELQATIVEKLAEGVSVAAACGMVGITSATYYSWVRKPRNLEQREFRDVTERARAEVLAAKEAAVAEVDPVKWLAKHRPVPRAGWHEEESPGWRDVSKTEVSGGLEFKVTMDGDMPAFVGAMLDVPDSSKEPSDA
jgi:hypothetical protein